MRLRLYVLNAILILGLSAAVAQAQAKGAQKGTGQKKQGQQTVRGSGQGSGAMERDRDRIQMTGRQHRQLQACDRSADQIRRRAGKLAKGASGRDFDPAGARKERDGLREQVRTMEQEHERLMQGMSPEQQQMLQSRIRNMNEVRERLHKTMAGIDGDLERPSPDGKRVAEKAREMERLSKEWRKHYREIQSSAVTVP